MNQCPRCGFPRGTQYSILPGCMCAFAVPLTSRVTPQRQWVGLTDEDKALFSSWLDHKTDDEVFAAIEDKLRSKNT